MKNLFKIKRLDNCVFLIIQLVAIALWGFQLLSSDAYYVNYALVIMIAVVCVYKNKEVGELHIRGKYSKYEVVIINLFSILFTCMVSFSNYKLWSFTVLPEEYQYRFKWCYHYCMIIMLLIGAYFAFKNIFIAFLRNINKINWNKCEISAKYKMTFIVCFALLVVTRLVVLFCSQYPGDLTPDSINQMSQLLNGSYSNHHPFYHTMVIKLFVMLGMYFFNDINAAIATYSVFQIIFTSMCFAFAASTVARMKAPRWIVIAYIMFFLLMPYHIIYSITMWKDIMFGCFVLMLVTSIFRCMNNIGHVVFEYSMVVIASLGTCLFRSNGFFAFVILTIAFGVLWKVKNKRILIVLCLSIIISFIMKHAVLTCLEVTQPDTIESLSIPAQQMARVLKEGRELDDWQSELLNDVIDTDRVPEYYLDYLSDPIKDLVRQKGNQNLLLEKKIDFIKLYVSLGVKYPKDYFRAWIDQTRGYWNGGYDYWRWYLGITENDLGLVRTTKNISIDLMLREYIWLFTDIQALKLFLSIGLFIWVDILMFMLSLLRKDKVGVFMSLPILAVVASLLVATPAFSEFRYIYAAFCVLPLVIIITLRPLDEGKGRT